MFPKLVVCDVDGTLVSDGTKAVTEKLNELAELIRSKDLLFTIASGRSPEQLLEIKERLNVALPIISYNGALITDGDKVIENHFLCSSIMKEIVELGDFAGLSILMGIGGHEYTYRNTPYITHHQEDYGWYHNKYDFDMISWSDTKINKILFFDYEAFKDKSQGKADVVYHKLLSYEAELDLIRYDEYCVEVMPKGINKANGVRTLAEILHIDMDCVMAIGDSDNDLQMIRECGIGVAVNNAVGILKKDADYICEYNDIEGVMESIRRFGFFLKLND